jgi:hypothetical protein
MGVLRMTAVSENNYVDRSFTTRQQANKRLQSDGLQASASGHR